MLQRLRWSSRIHLCCTPIPENHRSESENHKRFKENWRKPRHTVGTLASRMISDLSLRELFGSHLLKTFYVIVLKRSDFIQPAAGSSGIHVLIPDINDYRAGPADER